MVRLGAHDDSMLTSMTHPPNSGGPSGLVDGAEKRSSSKAATAADLFMTNALTTHSLLRSAALQPLVYSYTSIQCYIVRVVTSPPWWAVPFYQCNRPPSRGTTCHESHIWCHRSLSTQADTPLRAMDTLKDFGAPAIHSMAAVQYCMTSTPD